MELNPARNRAAFAGVEAQIAEVIRRELKTRVCCRLRTFIAKSKVPRRIRKTDRSRPAALINLHASFPTCAGPGVPKERPSMKQQTGTLIARSRKLTAKQ